MHRRLRLGTLAAVATLVIAPWLASSQVGVQAQSGGRSQDGAEDQCDHLPDPPGKARGIERRCSRGSSAGVARGDFNADGFGDLAIGAPFEDSGSAENSGAVYVIYGSPSGLLAPVASSTAAIPAQKWTQASPGVPGSVEKDDNFGMGLAAGDFNNDTYPDLAIGAPNEDVDGAEDAGSVTIIYGSPQGLSASSVAVSDPSVLTMQKLRDSSCVVIRLEGVCESHQWTYVIEGNARFGSALVWGDFDGDGAKDLVVGAPSTYKTVVDINSPLDSPFGTDLPHAGIAVVFYGTAGTPLTGSGRKSILFQPNPDDGNDLDVYAEEYDEFGATLAAGNFDGDLKTDLAVGVPYEDLNGVSGAGLVEVFYGCSSRLATCERERFAQELSQSINEIGTSPAEPSDWFGLALATGDFDGDTKDDLAIGVPHENVGDVINAGIVQIIYGSNNGLDPFRIQTWSQNGIFGANPSIYEGSPSESYDYFGSSLAAADFNGDGKKDLAIGVPYENVVTDRSGTLRNVADAGEVDVLYGSIGVGLSKTGRAPQMWHQDAINIEGEVAEGDRFGTSLSAWNFGGANTLPDLAIGVPLEDVNGVGNCGAVAVLYSSLSSNGVSSSSDQLWTLESANVPGICQTNGKFGYALY
jgi:hypothetical protein